MNAVVVGVSWGFLRRDVTTTRRDVVAIKKALGLEPTNGRIEAAFVPRAECRLRGAAADDRIEAHKGQLGDHEHRLTVLEMKADVGREPF